MAAMLQRVDAYLGLMEARRATRPLPLVPGERCASTPGIVSTGAIRLATADNKAVPGHDTRRASGDRH